MVRHVILWQLKDELTDAEKKEVKKNVKTGLEGLVGKVPGLVDAHVHTDGLESSNADMMLDAVLLSEQDLKNYAVHPEHVKVADTCVRPNVKTRVCMDYVD